MTTLLQHLDDLVLVLGEDFGETIGPLDKIVLSGTGDTTGNRALRVVDLGTEGKQLACLFGDSDGITSQHLDAETEVLSFEDGVSGIVTRGVEHGQHANELPGLIATLWKQHREIGNHVGRSQLRYRGSVWQWLHRTQQWPMTALGAPLQNAHFSPLRVQVVVIRLETGSKGVYFSVFQPCCRISRALGYRLRVKIVILSMGSRDFRLWEEARAAHSHHPVDIFTLGDIGLSRWSIDWLSRYRSCQSREHQHQQETQWQSSFCTMAFCLAR